jgi:hypothetical protein
LYIKKIDLYLVQFESFLTWSAYKVLQFCYELSLKPVKCQYMYSKFPFFFSFPHLLTKFSISKISEINKKINLLHIFYSMKFLKKLTWLKSHYQCN